MSDGRHVTQLEEIIMILSQPEIYVIMIIIVYEKHLNIQKVIRCRQSKKDREYYRKRRKKAIKNNGPLNTTQKTK
jgi:hypothetical protein